LFEQRRQWRDAGDWRYDDDWRGSHRWYVRRRKIYRRDIYRRLVDGRNVNGRRVDRRCYWRCSQHGWSRRWRGPRRSASRWLAHGRLVS
jgi:hypothetical protein